MAYYTEAFLEIPSDSNPRKKYDIRIGEELEGRDVILFLSCNCPAWTSSGKNSGKETFERSCKHCRRAWDSFNFAVIRALRDRVSDLGRPKNSKVYFYLEGAAYVDETALIQLFESNGPKVNTASTRANNKPASEKKTEPPKPEAEWVTFLEL